MSEAEKPKSFDERMQDDCDAKGVTSLLYQVPNGNAWLFVSKHELEPVTAFLKAMIDVMMARGFTGTDGPVTIRRLTSGLIAPGKEVFWHVKDLETGDVYASGYCGNEDEARQLIADAILRRSN